MRFLQEIYQNQVNKLLAVSYFRTLHIHTLLDRDRWFDNILITQSQKTPMVTEMKLFSRLREVDTPFFVWYNETDQNGTR